MDGPQYYWPTGLSLAGEGGLEGQLLDQPISRAEERGCDEPGQTGGGDLQSEQHWSKLKTTWTAPWSNIRSLSPWAEQLQETCSVNTAKVQVQPELDQEKLQWHQDKSCLSESLRNSRKALEDNKKDRRRFMEGALDNPSPIWSIRWRKIIQRRNMNPVVLCSAHVSVVSLWLHRWPPTLQTFDYVVNNKMTQWQISVENNPRVFLFW